MIWLMCLLIPFAAAAKSSLTKVDACKTPKSDKTIMIVKQWHLPPTTITQGFKEKYPHEKNQTAIFERLSDAVKKKKLDLVVGEGCEGEINDEFETAFNGWDLAELKKQAQTKNYRRIISHVPLKLEARWGDRLLTVCGDDQKLIKEGNLRMSNLRGWMGFWTRLSEAKPDDERAKLYADTAADLLKLPRTTPIADLKAQIHTRTREELDLFLKSLKDRNESFVKALQSYEFKHAAVVIGGLHAGDLKSRLELAGLPCEVFEPTGYIRQDEKLIEEFRKSLQN